MNSKAVKPFFRAALQSDGTLEIVIYEEIGEDWWNGGGLTAKTVKQRIDQAGEHSRILVRINSPGGDAFEAIAIYNILDQQKKPVEVRIDGVAASAASIIAMAGDQIIMGANALMMIHNAWGACIGEASDMTRMADALNKISGAIAQTYVGQTGKTAEQITVLMDAETWMTAEECIEEGFADAIAAEPEVEETALAMARKFKALKHLKRVPEGLKVTASARRPACRADACACDCDSCRDGSCDECTNADCEDANCADCPMQAVASAELELYEMRARALTRDLHKAW